MPVVINGSTGIISPGGDTSAADNTINGVRVGEGAGSIATNTVVGASALNSNTTGSNNTAVGYQAGYANTTGASNVFVGNGAGVNSTTSSFHTVVGKDAMAVNTTGAENSVFGQGALYANTTGSNNVAVGRLALTANTTASNNTAVGYQAGYSNTTATNNVFLGYQAGYTQTTAGAGGGANTYLGYRAGYSATGYYNTFVGIQAGQNSTGNGNTFVGATGTYASGQSMTSGNNNTILGNYSGNNGGLDIRTASNYIVLSDGDGNPRCYWTNNGVMFQSISYTDNYVAQIINSTATRPYGQIIKFTGATPNNTTEQFFECQDSTNTKLVIYSNGTVSNRTGTYNSISDAKLKENIVDATPKLDKLMDVKVRNYNLIGEDLKQIGFVAQELETVFPSLIDNVPDLDENRQPTGEVTKGVKLTVMIPILVKAIQELKAEVDSLKAQLNK